MTTNSTTPDKQNAPAQTEAPKQKTAINRQYQKYYTAMSDLAQQHYDMLKASAISDEVIKERGYKTIANAGDLRPFGFSESQLRAPGLLLPLHTTDGQTPLYVFRPDNPRVLEDKKHRNPDGTFKEGELINSEDSLPF